MWRTVSLRVCLWVTLAAALAAAPAHAQIAKGAVPAKPAKAPAGPTKIRISVAECENKLWVDMPGGMSPYVETEGPETLPECAGVALSATKNALTASSGLTAAAKGLSVTVDLLGKAAGVELAGDAAIKVLQAAIESGGSLDGFTDKLGDAALEKGAEGLGGALGLGADKLGGKLSPEQEELLKKIGENLWKVLKTEETVQTHTDSFHFGACDGEFVVTVTANFGQATGEVRIAASGDCHCTEMRGGVRVGKFSVVGSAPLTFGDLHRGAKNEWTMSCSMGSPQYYVWAPCCRAEGDHWTAPVRTPPPSTVPVQPSPEERRKTADRQAIARRCDPDGEKSLAVSRAQMTYDLLRADNADDAALEAARKALADAQKPLCDCLHALRNDPSLAGDAGLLALLDDTLDLYCRPPARYVRPAPVPVRPPPPPCESFRDEYEGARSRAAENPNSPSAELAMVNAKRGLCECLRRQNGGKLPPEAEAFCDPKTRSRPAAAPLIAAVPALPSESTLVGVVVSSHAHRGERTTVTLVTDPKTYETLRDVVVVTATVPLPRGRDGKPVLDGTTVRVGDGPAYPATGPIPCDVPKDGVRPRIVVTPSGGKPVTIGEVPVLAGDAPAPPAGTTGPPTCTPGGTITLRGPFGGDGRATRVMVGGRTVPVVCETPGEAVVRVPPDVPAGPVEIVVREGTHERRLVLAAIGLRMSADRLSLLRGESTAFRVTVDGLGSIGDAQWAGGPDPAALDRGVLDRAAPGFRVPPRGGPGVLVLVIENGSKGTITIRKSAGETVVLTIERGAVSAAGTYEYAGTIQSLKDGTFRVSGTVVPLLAPAQAEEVR
ncbi:MAG TPA: hypothetical protein VMV60_14185 [Thermoanaerobaculia bacterium]|nr:hypothetical protein [Thermoanaerobaculia bacterium]